MGAGVALGSDPYAVLGVPRDATDAEIAQARRRLSLQFHPDVNSSPDAATRFDAVQQAYDLLSDPAVRAEYNRATGTPGQGGTAAGGQGQATEVAPGIFIQPTAVDFGLLHPGRPKAYARLPSPGPGRRQSGSGAGGAARGGRG
jgi:curved DNA-binding protein CbpA